jgi:hypothetical protein
VGSGAVPRRIDDALKPMGDRLRKCLTATGGPRSLLLTIGPTGVAHGIGIAGRRHRVEEFKCIIKTVEGLQIRDQGSTTFHRVTLRGQPSMK